MLPAFRRGESEEHIAKRRALVAERIYRYWISALEPGQKINLDHMIHKPDYAQIKAVFNRFGLDNLTGVHKALDGRIIFDILQLYPTARKSDFF